MAGLTNRIEHFLLEMLQNQEEGILEIGRNELAERFDCAPSQINYVLTTRFTPYKGYYIESRRGGAGYIRIIRLERSPEDVVSQTILDAIGDEITTDKAKHIIRAFYEQNLIDEQSENLMKLALDNQALHRVPLSRRNEIRADIFKNMLVALLHDPS